MKRQPDILIPAEDRRAMIYDELSFTATPDPRHPGRFRIFAHPPDGETLTADRRTRILETHVKVADVEPKPAVEPARELPPEPTSSKATQAARYLPTPDQIKAAAAAIRAANLRDTADAVARPRVVARHPRP